MQHAGALITVTVTTNPADLKLASLKIFIDDGQAADASPAEVLAPLGVSLLRVEATTMDGTLLEDEEYLSVTDLTPPLLQAWFEDRKTGRAVTTINSRLKSKSYQEKCHCLKTSFVPSLSRASSIFSRHFRESPTGS
jgi:hypothetical protein